MPELLELPQTERQRIEELGAADLVIGVFAPFTAQQFETILANVRDSIGTLYTHVRAIVIHPGDQPTPPLDDIRVLAVPALKRDLAIDPAFALSEAYHGLLAVGDFLHARASALIVSDLDTVTPQWIYRLVRPVLELDFDIVAPCYFHDRFDGLVNTAIVAPFTRAMYGRQLQHPLGPDFAISAKFGKHLLARAAKKHPRSLASFTVDAICDGFEICQATVGERHYPPVDWMNQSAVLTQILGPVFQETELHAPQWQRIRGSHAVQSFAETPHICASQPPPGIQRMLESFQIGFRNLQEIWGAVLPPGTLLELGRLARTSADHFRLPDRLWARIVYDFALGHRLRTISPDHLIRAMTPLYLAWVASYVLDIADAGTQAADARIQELALAFESSKPYFLSRWRWPDRFNP